MIATRQRGLVNTAVLVALLLAMFPASSVFSPRAARAQESGVDSPAAPSADASEEIVYIDGNGTIRVIDTTFSGKQVQWFSSSGNWRSIALGDFDVDGDKEVVAVRGTPGTSTAPVLVIYDPVVAKGAIVPGQTINDIPWKVMFSLPLPSRPELVFAGNFDPNVPGDEIGIVRAVVPEDGADAGDVTRVIIYKQTSTTPDGTAWEEHQIRDFSDKWERVAVGNLDKTGGDDVAFVDTDAGTFAVYAPDDNFKKIKDEGSQTKPWKDVAFGQYLKGGNHEMLAVRTADPPLNAFTVWEYSGGSLSNDKGDKFDPGPRIVFTGDINGSNDDDEAIMVRTCSGNCRRLIVRNDGSDGIIKEFSDGLTLDTDNGWRTGAAGDIDGDSRDEIVIIRSDKIRIYADAHNSANSSDINTSTDREHIFIGDLDRNGYISGPVIGSTPGTVEKTVYLGYKDTGTIRLQNVSTQDPIPFTAQSNAGWLSVSPLAGTMPGASGTPVELTYQIDATQLQAGQRYVGAIIVSNTNGGLNVANSPYNIAVTIDVVLPPFGAVPDGAVAFYHPCSEPLDERTLDFQIVGYPGNTFTAQVTSVAGAAAAGALQGDFFLGEVTSSGVVLTDREGAQAVVSGDTSPTAIGQTSVMTWPTQAAWVTSVTSITDTMPTTLTVTISPTLRTADLTQAKLLLLTKDPSNPSQGLVKLHDIDLVCATGANWMPMVSKGE